ncbi:MAG: hypothetical protein M3332_13265, partial [Actinomycetota bacterium]|nr:hypothetical protein [Actinomycetota bacterium]
PGRSAVRRKGSLVSAYREIGLSAVIHIDRYLVRWARRKYKHLRRAPRRAGRTLAEIKRARPGLLAHWRWEIQQRTATARTG